VAALGLLKEKTSLLLRAPHAVGIGREEAEGAVKIEILNTVLLELEVMEGIMVVFGDPKSAGLHRWRRWLKLYGRCLVLCYQNVMGMSRRVDRKWHL